MRRRIDAAEAIYIDDRPDLVAAGQALGFSSIRFESKEQLLEDLKKLGVISTIFSSSISTSSSSSTSGSGCINFLQFSQYFSIFGQNRMIIRTIYNF